MLIGTSFLKFNEKLRRDKFNYQLAILVQAIPGMSRFANTRKSVLLYTNDYVRQLQWREKRLRSQLMSHHLRERALVTAVLNTGAARDDIQRECSANGTEDLDRVAAIVEALVAGTTSAPW